MNVPHTDTPSPGFDRRAFLASSAAGLAFLPTLGHTRAASPRWSGRSSPSCVNVIFMVSDGMSAGTLTLADLMRRRRDGRGSHWMELWNKPGVVRSSAFTASADSPVTDSAAGGSAWGCGQHVNNEVLNITPDGVHHAPIFASAQKAGKATGVVTTARVTHATPASFYANISNRALEQDIANQLLACKLDLALGGGAKYFQPPVLDAAFPQGAQQPVIARTRAQLLTLPPGSRASPLLGLFDKEHVPYVLDATDETPSLAEMTRVALGQLSTRPNGFVLQIEGGRVDHAAHNNDAGSLLAEQLAFDDAIGTVVEFTKDRDDTLVILTSDHGNANPGLTFYGQGALDRFDRLRHVKHSTEWIFGTIKTKAVESVSRQLIDRTLEATGITIAQAEADMIVGSLGGKRVHPFAASNSPVCVLGAILADSLGVAFLSPNHTSDLVEVTAFGPGSAGLPPVIDNVELWSVMARALGLDVAPR